MEFIVNADPRPALSNSEEKGTARVDCEDFLGGPACPCGVFSRRVVVKDAS